MNLKAYDLLDKSQIQSSALLYDDGTQSSSYVTSFLVLTWTLVNNAGEVAMLVSCNDPTKVVQNELTFELEQVS